MSAPDPVASLGFDLAAKVADAVLYEGYVLYPYRASATKNQLRWQFGVLVPPGYPDEPSVQQTELLVEGHEGEGDLRVALRFLRLQERRVQRRVGEDWHDADALEAAGEVMVPWDEGLEERVEATVPLADLIGQQHVLPFERPTAELVETFGDGRILRRRWPVSGRIVLRAAPVEASRPCVRLRVEVENTSPWRVSGAGRHDALRRSLLGVHTLLGVTGSRFVSLLEPPAWAEEAAAVCHNRQAFPVLVGDEQRRDTALSSPVLLYDFPRVAPESPGDFYDATEIDELLTLRTLTLTDAEKREARATDPRAAAIIDRVDHLPPEVMDRLHGTLRPPELFGGGRAGVLPAGPRPGTRVRLRPNRRADAHDLFVAGRTALVHKTVTDVDGSVFVAVTVDDDPAADLHDWYGRYQYFALDEIEVLEPAP